MAPYCNVVPFYLLLTILAIEVRGLSASLSSVNQSTWNAFSKSINGRLHNGRPMMAPCYLNYNGKSQIPDLGQCLKLQGSQLDSVFISDHFGGYQNDIWASCQETGQGCTMSTLLNDNSSPPFLGSCMQGSVPSKYVEVTSVDDVQKSLRFATEHNLRVVIKNTGHDYKGRSSAPDSFALWMHNYQPPIKLETNFTADGCTAPAGNVVTFGAGQEFQGIYDFAHAHNVRVVGGTSSSVGAAGGWITGGGHSMLSNEFGLGVDNVQQLRAVLPNGTYITANRCQNQDIFYALRGGGGGTFGVIMEMSTLAHPEKPMEVAQVTLANINRQSMREFISILVSNSDRWSSEGWGGYIQLGAVGNALVSFVMATSMLDHSQATASMQPVLDFAREAGFQLQANITSAPNYYDILGKMITAPSGSVALSSRIVPRQLFVENPTGLTSIIEELVFDTPGDGSLGLSPLLICFTTPALYSKNLPVSDQPGGPGEASVTPAWRDGLWHAIHIRLSTGLLTNSASTWKSVHEAINPLREFTPGSGAYQNEADPFEPDPAATFWGEAHYGRLSQIKKMVDPSNILTVHQGIGWDATDDRYRCYPNV
ncbi:FAD-binding domain-containing protein [Aspergillus ambiguus]|uniref:FAD-binding domain-containing protein n=1 Tax=Aspergillus ambiguus TaxID=176160 RepID=UPI003CCD3565